MPSQQKGIVWIGFLILDVFLHKTTQVEILKHLAERGNNVYLFALYSKRKVAIDNAINLTSIPLRYVPLITPFFFVIVLLIYFPFYVAAKKPKFVIVEPGLTVLIFIWKLHLSALGIKVILDIRTTPVDVTKFRRYLSALWFRVSVVLGKKAFDGITILTEMMKREICRSFQISHKFIGVWTSGVSTTLFDPKNHDSSKLRKKFALRGKFVVMYHGHLSSARGIFETIKAIAIIRNRYPKIIFFILGSGPAELAMKKLVQEIGVRENVIFHDSVPYNEIPKFVAMSNVGIIPLPNLPMWRNQCPLKLLEYLAMEKVVIATDIPANREIIGKSRCGIYISSTDPNEIASALIYAYNNRKMMEEWGRHGRIIVEKNYSWGKVADDLDTYLSHLRNSKSIARRSPLTDICEKQTMIF